MAMLNNKRVYGLYEDCFLMISPISRPTRPQRLTKAHIWHANRVLRRDLLRLGGRQWLGHDRFHCCRNYTYSNIIIIYIYMYPHVFITIHKRIYCIYNNDMAVYVYNTWWNICGRLWMHIEYVRCTERWVYHGPSVSPLTCNRGGVDTRGHDKTGITCGIRVGRVSLESLKDCPNFNIWGWFMGKYDSEKVDCSTENGNWPRGNPVFLVSTNLRRSNLVHVVESCPLPPISGLHSWLWVMALEPWWTPK